MYKERGRLQPDFVKTDEMKVIISILLLLFCMVESENTKIAVI